MKKMMFKALSAAVLTATLASNVSAQVTTSAVRGVVTDSAGQPVSGAVVKLINPNTGLTKTVVSDANGSFGIRNLPVSSGYTVVVQAEDFASQKTENIALSLGDVSELSFSLQATSNIEEIVVLGSSAVLDATAAGPSTTFSLEQLQSAPAINRNLTDIIRADSRVYIDESRGGVNAIQCAGKSPRFNSLTVDGVRMNDLFGLNDNGYPTERMPFSYDAINQVAVELAPFDVEYGGFTACNINAVTKSGTNEFFGSVFMDYTDDSLRADSLEGEDILSPSFEEYRYGINLGGPIIQDKLFFFAAYEKLEGANVFERGASDSNAITKVGATQAQLDEIAQIARDVYQYEPGAIPTSLDNEDEKLLVKIDWNISETQRLAVTYNYNDGNNFRESDDDNDEFEFENHLYERGAKLESFVAALYSDWSSEFSTELRIGQLDLNNRQNTVGGTDFGEIRVELDDVDVYLGGDDSRQANKLNYDVNSYAFKGDYFLGEHTISFGVERDELKVFNLFVQHTETEIRFADRLDENDNLISSAIDNFRNGFASRIDYNNAPSGNPADAAADWGYEINTVYAQDEFSASDKLTVVAGLRYEWYTSSDRPIVNQQFVDDYGFANNATIDGKGLLQPRLGFTYDFDDQLTIHGGLGLYSGGNPNVWLSNNFSNDNVSQFGQRGRSFGLTDGTLSLLDPSVVYEQVEEGRPAGPGYGVPKDLFDAVARGEGRNFELNYLDPDFDLPSEWKFSLGGSYITENEYVFSMDFLFSRTQDAAMVLRGDLDRTGTTAEGYPIYSQNRLGSFVLTNSERTPISTSVSMGVSKTHDNGIDWAVSYAYTDSRDTQPMNSAVSFSNYQNRAFFDPQEDVVSTSSYNIPHRFTGTLNYSKAFFGDNETRFSLFAQASQGPSYSYTLDRRASQGIYNFAGDPGAFIIDADNVLLAGDDRNEVEGSWWAKMDIKVTQEFPGLFDSHKASAFIVVDNFTNLLNDEWGIQRQADFPGNVQRGVAEEEPRIGESSQYEIRFGVQYDF